jgi:hypothetical protein
MTINRLSMVPSFPPTGNVSDFHKTPLRHARVAGNRQTRQEGRSGDKDSLRPIHLNMKAEAGLLHGLKDLFPWQEAGKGEKAFRRLCTIYPARIGHAEVVFTAWRR